MPHTAELIAVGAELLLGSIANLPQGLPAPREPFPFFILGRNESALRKCFADAPHLRRRLPPVPALAIGGPYYAPHR